MSFRGTRRTDGPDKPLDSSRDILCPTGQDVKISRFLSLSFDTRRPASSLTDHIFFLSSFFFFLPNIYAWQPMTFFPQGVQRRIYFITAAPTDIRHRIVIFHSYAVPSNHLCSLVPRRNWYWRSQFAILFRPCLPPFTLFDPCLRRQTEGHAPTIMADRDSLAFHFLYFISLSLCPLCSVIFEKHHALFRPPPIKHNSNIRTCSMLRCKGWKNYGLFPSPHRTIPRLI